MNSTDYTETQLAELIQKLEAAIDEVDEALASLGYPAVPRTTELRLRVVDGGELEQKAGE